MKNSFGALTALMMVLLLVAACAWFGGGDSVSSVPEAEPRALAPAATPMAGSGVTNFSGLDIDTASDMTSDALSVSQHGTGGVVSFNDGTTEVWTIHDGGVISQTVPLIIDGSSDAVQLTVQGHSSQTENTFVVETSAGTDLFWVDDNGDVEMNGTTPFLTIGDAGEEDAGVVFDGAEQDFNVSLDDTANDLVIGLGSAAGTTDIIVLDENQDVGLGAASAGSKLDVTGNVMIDGDTDEVQLTVQGHSTQSSAPNLFVVETSGGSDLFWVTNSGDAELNGTTPFLTIGDAGEEDAGFVFDGAEQDFNISLDDTANDLVLGLGSAAGTTDIIVLDENQDVGLGGASAGSKLDVTGNVLIDGAADEIQFTVQGNSTQNTGLLVLEQSDGTDKFTVDNAGAVVAASSVTMDSASIGGGYGSTGCSISNAGVLQCNGAMTGDSSLTIDSVSVGGGYGSTGITLSTAGAGQFNSTLTVDASAGLNGGITVDSTAFTVADTTGNVATAGTATVAGDLTVSDAFTVTQSSGNTEVRGTLTALGSAALDGGISVDTTAFTVADATGNMATAGTGTVGGDFTVSDAFTVTQASGNTEVAGTLTGAGDLTINDAFTVTQSSGNTEVRGTLTALGSAALDGGISVDTTAFTVADATGNMATAGTATVAGDLTVSDAFTLTQASGNAAVRGTLSVLLDEFTVSAPAGAGSGGDLLDLTATFAAMDGSDVSIGIDINLTGADASSTGNYLIGIDLDLTTPDAQVIEKGIDLNDSDWDMAIDTGHVPIIDTSQRFMDDFFGDTMLAEWTLLEGSDGQAVQAIGGNALQYGEYQITSGDDDAGGCAASCEGITMGTHWSADQGSLVFEARLHIDSAVGNDVICLGLTDNAGLEMPANINASDVITNTADDCLVFCFNDAATTDEWFAIGAAGGTGATGSGATGVAPTNDVYQTFRIVVDAAGADAWFFINGSLVKTLTANAITPTDLLTPFVIVDTNTDASNVVDVDYIFTSAQRQ